jgi:hypothetical protein
MTKILRPILASVLLSLTPLLSAAQSFYGITRVNPDPSGTSERTPIMHIGRDGGIYIAYIKGGADGDIYFTRSDDKGSTFMTPVRVTMSGKINAAFQRTAQFVLDTKDNIHMVWMENRIHNQPDVWYVRSTNKGMTWTTPISVLDTDDSTKYVQDFCSIAVDSSDNLYVSFLDFREDQRKTSMNAQLYLSRSTDGGDSWSVNTKANIMPGGIGGTCECCKQDIAVSPEGHVYIAFRSNMNNRRDIWVARSMDKGNSFEEIILVQSGVWNLAACPTSGPNITLDANENLHIAWADARGDSAGTVNAYYSRLPKNSRQATPNQRLNAKNELPKWPDVATTRDGSRVQATYQVTLKSVKFVASITDEKTSQGFEIAPTDKIQEYGRITIAPNGTTYVVWQDNRRDNGDIYFGKYESATSVGYDHSENDLDLRLFPNPASDEVNLDWENIVSPTSNDLQAKLYSASGKLIKRMSVQRNMPIDIHDVPSGSYQLIIYDQSKQIIEHKLTVVH